jgi:hypothetical protein
MDVEDGSAIATHASLHDIDTKVFDTEEKRHMPVKDDPSLFPDGGWEAWSVVGASFLLVFCNFGEARIEAMAYRE